VDTAGLRARLRGHLGQRRIPVQDHRLLGAEHERAILWNDPAIGIDWPALDAAPLLSGKDAAAALLADAEVFA
jgi:hypothetical protein